MIVASVSAFADVAANTYTITVENTKDTVSIVGTEFKAYKLFDVTYTGSNSDDPHSYYFNTSNPFYTGTSYASGTWTYSTAANIVKDYFDFTYNSNDTTKVYVALKENKTAADLYTMTQALIEAKVLPSTPNASATGAKDGNKEKAVIDVSNKGDAGYYIVTGEGKATANNQAVVAAAALTTTDPKADIVAKLDAPGLDKKIDEHAERVAGTKGTLEIEDVTGNERSIGDNVPYIIKGTVPNMTGYEKYYYIVSDTLSGGLTFKDDIIVKINGNKVDATNGLTVGNTAVKYAVTYSVDGGTTWANTLPSTYAPGTDLQIRIGFTNFIALKGTLQADGTYSGDYTGKDIVITYSADLNEKAIIGQEGNPNKAKLIYSTKPDQTDDGEPDHPEWPKDFNVTGETPEVDTWTYTTGVKLLKVEKNSVPQKLLAGAIFEISGEKVTNVVTYGSAFEQAADGTYYKLKDGSYTTVSPLSDEITNASNKEELQAKYEDKTGAKKYKAVQTQSVIKKAENVQYQVTSGADGVIIFDGLGEGEYTITEIKAPDGYNLLTAPITLKIEWTAPTAYNVENPKCTWSAATGSSDGWQFVLDDANHVGRFELTVENSKGTELPSTGGMGTTILYVGGSILVILAAVLLITKRRMNAQD